MEHHRDSIVKLSKFYLQLRGLFCQIIQFNTFLQIQKAKCQIKLKRYLKSLPSAPHCNSPENFQINNFQTKIWQEQVKKESDIAKQWEEDWGYQLGYDQLGNEREAKQLPRVENVSLFNKENFPITGNYQKFNFQIFQSFSQNFRPKFSMTPGSGSASKRSFSLDS